MTVGTRHYHGHWYGTRRCEKAGCGLSVLDKLHAIEGAKTIYDIHYCRAGVGFIFYDGPDEQPVEQRADRDWWRKFLTVERYYANFEDAVAAEYDHLSAQKE